MLVLKSQEKKNKIKFDFSSLKKQKMKVISDIWTPLVLSLISKLYAVNAKKSCSIK